MHNGDANQLTCAGNISATKDNEHTITPKGDVHHGGIQLRTTTKVQYVSAIRLGQGFFSTNRKYCGNNTLGTGGTHQPASAVEQDAASLPYPAIPFFLQIAALKVMVEPRRCDGGTDTRLPEWPAAALPWKRGHPPKGRLPGPWPSAPPTAHIDVVFRAWVRAMFACRATLPFGRASPQCLQMLRKGLQVATGLGAKSDSRLVMPWVLFKNPQSFQLIMGVN